MATANRAPLHLILAALFLTAHSLTLAEDSPDAAMLLKFKSGISDPTGSLASWTGNRPCNNNFSSWAGVICNPDSTLLGLQLENMGLSGKLDLGVLRTLPELRTLSFMNNKFEGPMPEVKTLGSLRSIYLSGNQFSGDIPGDAFWGMGNLKKVYLSSNKFTGKIPVSLVGVPRLLELRLDGNEFQGEIPDLKQRDLALVNMSNNALAGKIPDRLSKMGADLFAGNKNLCGPPLQSPCPSTSSSSPPPSASRSNVTVVVILAAVGMFVLACLILVGLKRWSHMPEEQFGRPPSSHASKQTAHSTKSPEQLEQGPDNYHNPASGSSKRGGSRGGSGAHHDQGRLVFVIEGRGRFELHDLLKSSAEVLGTGSLGCSYKATLTEGPSMIVKRFRDMNRVGKEDFEEHMRRLGRLSHPNLLPLVAYYYRKEEKLLVTDFVPNPCLAFFLHSGNPKARAALDWPARLRIVKGVAQALSYVYEELTVLNVPHGHLKSSNVLIGSSFEPLLSDYALVPVVNQSHATNSMAAFRSPERRQVGCPSKKSDVWCFGMLMLEILTGKPGIPNTNDSVHKGQSYDLGLWIGSVPEEEWADKVIDGDIVRATAGKADAETVKMLMRIGLACCESDVDKRLEMKEAVERIEELGGKRDREFRDQDGFSSATSSPVTEDDNDFSSVAI